MVDVVDYTQSLFHSGKREGRGGKVVGVKGSVGGLQGDEPFFMGAQPHHAATAKTRIIRHGDKRKCLPAEGVPGIKDGDGLLR